MLEIVATLPRSTTIHSEGKTLLPVAFFDFQYVARLASTAILPVWLGSWKDETETGLATAKFVDVGVGVAVGVLVGVFVGVDVGV